MLLPDFHKLVHYYNYTIYYHRMASELPLLSYLLVARACRNAGYRLVYNGLHQDPKQIVSTAIQEDTDLIGLSYLCGAHVYLFSRAGC